MQHQRCIVSSCLILFLLYFVCNIDHCGAMRITIGHRKEIVRKLIVYFDAHNLQHEADNTKEEHFHAHSSPQQPHIDQNDPSLNVFFTINDLQVGKTIPVFFPINDPSRTPKLLPREITDSIPFSSSNLSYLLDFFSHSKNSPLAKAMEYTLKQCELEPMRGETKFCATSLETLIDLTRGVFGLGKELKSITTTYPKSFNTSLQNYTILEKPKQIWAPKIVSCHTMPYPYTVFYCHSQEGDNMLFEISLVGENRERVEAAAICHMDTSEWDSDHVVFRVLKIKPGSSPVCHFYPADDLAWIPSTSAALM